jgi:hypothetical protein
MKRFSSALLWAGIGALVGGVATAIPAVLVSGPDSRFFAETVRGSAIAGVIGGMVCGLLLGVVTRSAALAGVAGLGGSLLCCVGMIGAAFIYGHSRWPSPQPYPGCEATVEIGGGSGSSAEIREYAVALSLEAVEQYYDGQMARYCVDEWDFSTSPWCESEGCVEATCAIRRLGREQFFQVTLFPLPGHGTRVRQIDSWEI